MLELSGQTNPWIETILSDDEAIRHRSLESLCLGLSTEQLLDAASHLDDFVAFRQSLPSRSGLILFSRRLSLSPAGNFRRVAYRLLAYEAYQHILERRFGEAIDLLLENQRIEGPTLAVTSALAKAYYQFGFQTLADQVRRSVRTVRGNQWMFRIGHPVDHPLRMANILMEFDAEAKQYPLLRETTAVRMDFSHSGWSDIFFLGMDYPEGARVVNAAINLVSTVATQLRVHGRSILSHHRSTGVTTRQHRPRRRSRNRGDRRSIRLRQGLPGFAKSALIASGVVPPAMEGCHRPIRELLKTLTGRRDLGIELVSQVNDIPKVRD